jgi:hypothetical protein
LREDGPAPLFLRVEVLAAVDAMPWEISRSVIHPP